MKLFNTIKNYLAQRRFDKTYRIVEMNNVFIPQIHTYDWQAIDRGEDPDDPYANQTWGSHDIQIRLCGWSTYEQANERLLQYIDYQEKKILKVHKVTVEPKAWRILKRK